MSMINKAYIELQKEIVKKQAIWQKQMNVKQKVEKENNCNVGELPLIHQVKFEYSIELYRTWIMELIDMLIEHSSKLVEDLKTLKKTLHHDTCARWFREVLAFNEDYFITYANERGIKEWIPQFLAEHAVRPYLREIAFVFHDKLENNYHGFCPCCGEAIRLATLEGKSGKKMIHCPRCYATWQEKRTVCPHCGKDHTEKMTYFQLEQDPSMQIHVCNDCNGYVKVINEKERMTREEAFLLDLQSIHLDILAQEKGYMITNVHRGQIH